MSNIFVAKNYKQRGPFSEEELLSLLGNGEFSRDDLAWKEGMEEWQPLQTVLGLDDPASSSDDSPPVDVRFHHVAPAKFIVMALITGGLYELYWLYRGWKAIKREEASKIMPFWRAFFAPVWFYSFARRVFDAEGRHRTGLAITLAGGYLVSSALWQLPDPYWLLSFASILFLLPVVTAVDHINKEQGRLGPAYRRFGIIHGVAALVGVPLLALSLAATFGFIPTTRVVKGERIPEFHVEFLREAQVLPADESMVYFYSAGFTDYRMDGNFFTANRVVSYWQEAGDLWIEEALLSDVEEIIPDYAPAAWNDTILTIKRTDGSEFVLYLSAEGEGDRLFVDALTENWRAVNGPAAVGEL